jgi:hypothetical protein
MYFVIHVRLIISVSFHVNLSHSENLLTTHTIMNKTWRNVIKLVNDLINLRDDPSIQVLDFGMLYSCKSINIFLLN